MRSMILMLLASIAIQQGNQRLKKHYMREGVVAALKKRGYEDVEGKEMNKLLHIYKKSSLILLLEKSKKK